MWLILLFWAPIQSWAPVKIIGSPPLYGPAYLDQKVLNLLELEQLEVGQKKNHLEVYRQKQGRETVKAGTERKILVPGQKFNQFTKNTLQNPI
jgi:hypothetical protein